MYRIIEIERAVKHNEPFHPSHKRPRKTKLRKKKQPSRSDYSAQSDTDSLTQAEFTDGPSSKGKEKEKENFGLELTNAVLLQVGSPPKRVAAEMLEGGLVGTPRKHKKGKVSVDVEDDGNEGDWEQWEPPAPSRKQEVL